MRQWMMLAAIIHMGSKLQSLLAQKATKRWIACYSLPKGGFVLLEEEEQALDAITQGLLWPQFQ